MILATLADALKQKRHADETVLVDMQGLLTTDVSRRPLLFICGNLDIGEVEKVRVQRVKRAPISDVVIFANACKSGPAPAWSGAAISNLEISAASWSTGSGSSAHSHTGNRGSVAGSSHAKTAARLCASISPVNAAGRLMPFTVVMASSRSRPLVCPLFGWIKGATARRVQGKAHTTSLPGGLTVRRYITDPNVTLVLNIPRTIALQGR
ncbi:hypothetical protein DL767_009784 [Monosporascus sp. MG133]|nr:hypothetical protein DL767_009784 [Monosporascus sp. MG133]